MKKFKITQTIRREAIIEAESVEEATNLLHYLPFGFAWQETEKNSVITEVEDEEDEK